MRYKANKPAIVKRIARFILSIFVLSVLNLSMQAPAHAVMKIQMQQPDMQEMTDCHCPPALCDSVLALDKQSVDGVGLLESPHVRSDVLFEMLEQNPGLLNQRQHVETIFLNVTRATPSKLLIKTLLLI